MGLPFAGIVRVSSMAGRKSGAADFHSERDQHTTILASGLEIVMLPSELDVSGGGAIEDRPALLEAVEGVEAGRYAGVVVAYLSRLGRSVRHQLAAWDRIEAAGGRIVVVQEGIDTSTPTGRLYRTIMLGIAEHERDLHVERFAGLREYATAAGIWQRRQTPTGYSRDPKTRKLVPDADADRVRAAFDARAAGASLRSMAPRLGMTPPGVAALLKNRVYLGELKVGEHVNPTAHPPIVSVEAFEAAQIRQARPPRSVEYGGAALLAGVARCAGCGYPLTRGSAAARPGRQRYRYYRCATRHAGGKVCTAPTVIAEGKLDEYVESHALHLLFDTEIAVGAAATGEAQRAALAAAEAELTAYVAAVSAADIGAEAFGTGARQRRELVEAARAALRATAGATAPLVGSPYITPGAGYLSLNSGGRNHVLRGLFERVNVKRGGPRGRNTPIAERVEIVEGNANLRALLAGMAREFPGHSFELK